MTNRLYYGDNLDVLRTHIPDESVDLIYLDPPFNSNAGYNVLFKSASGTNRPLTVMMNAMHSAIGENPLIAYLAMMAVRLVERSERLTLQR